jgi:GntR family transcriptional regulator/MocR family aminotransferase
VFKLKRNALFSGRQFAMSKSIPDTLKVLLESPLSREAGGESLQKQLYQRILEGVREGSIPPETRLPGTRQLAESLAIARNTVIAVFEQLAAEGIIFTSTRGSIVSGNLESINAGAESLQPVAPTAESGYQLPSIAEADLPFFSGIPALGHFPLSAWRRTEDKVLQNNASSALGYGDPAGEPLLRETIATHLTMTRGVRCKPSQVFITAGLTKSMSMLVRMLTRPGDTVWMEDPGYWGARALFTQSRLNIHSVPVDQEGVSPPSGDWLQHPPKLIYTTPNHQYPTGVVLSQHRRMELIQAAQTHGTWILEDDYGSELRLHSESLVSMQGLTENAPVIYINSFSKTMFPALRIGYFVLPETLIPRLDAILMTTPHGGNKLSHLAIDRKSVV